MTRFSALFLIALLLPAAGRAETPSCAPGRLMDAASVRQITPPTASPSGDKVYEIKLQRDDTIFTVHTTGTATADPARLTRFEKLALCVADGTMTIRRADGKEITAKVVREVVESNY